MPSRSIALAVLVVLASTVLGAARAAMPPELGPVAGRPVVEILGALESDDLRFLYSSELLPATLIARRSPSSPDSVQFARELLADVGLALSSESAGLWVVVMAPSPRAASSRSPSLPAIVAPLSEIVVSASRYSVGATDVSALRRIDGAELNEQPGFGDDALRAMERLPGVSSNGVSARSNVRGSDASETLVLLDGYPLRQPYHLAGYQSLFSVLDSGLVGSAEVFTGGFPVRYGNRMAAVFDLRSIDGMTGPRRSLALDFFNATARGSGRQEPSGLEWLASGRIGTLKPLLKAFAPDTGTPTYSDAFLKGSIGDLATLKVTANLLWSRDELAISDARRGERAQIDGRNRYAWLHFERESETLHASLWAGQSQIDSVREGSALQTGVIAATVADARESELSDVRGLLRWQVAPDHVIEAGFEYTDEEARYRYASSVAYPATVARLFARAAGYERQIDLAPERERGTVFAAHRWRISEALTTELGVRTQRLVTTDEDADWIFDPRIGLRWDVSPQTGVRIHWGQFHQVDEINELQVEDGRTQFGAAQLSEHRIIGIERTIASGFELRVEAFEKRQSSPRARYENLLNVQTILPEIAPDRVRVAPTHAALRGLEFSGNYTGDRASAWTSFSVSRAFDRFGGRSELRNWDQTWALTGGGSWSQGPWRVSASLDVHRGWPTTSLLATANGARALGPRNSDRLPVFAQLDLRGQYTFRLDSGELALSAELMNAQIRENACCTELYVDTTAGQASLATRRLYWLPIIPSLGVRWSF